MEVLNQELISIVHSFNDIMKSEKNRLLTFSNWPNSAIDPKELAKAGFYSTHFEDAVRCAFCDVEICRWEEGDNAMADHQRWSNTCPFVRGFNVGNIPLDSNENIDLSNQDIYCRYGIEIRPNSVPENTNKSNLNKLGIVSHVPSAFKKYITLEARLQSYKEWPISIKQKPHDLAAAGLFYLGNGDRTVCFSCGGILKDWTPNDNPWEQHARWFPKCSFVLALKGQEFVSHATGIIPTTTVNELDINLTDESHVSNNNNDIDNDNLLCKICYKNELNTALIPCGHIVCVECAGSIATCAICRKLISATFHIYL